MQRRLQASMTAARNRQPLTGLNVLDAGQPEPIGTSGVELAPDEIGAAGVSLDGIVVRYLFLARRETPSIPSCLISLATRLRPMPIP